MITDVNWFKAKSSDDKTGLVPSNYSNISILQFARFFKGKKNDYSGDAKDFFF